MSRVAKVHLLSRRIESYPPCAKSGVPRGDKLLPEAVQAPHLTLEPTMEFPMRNLLTSAIASIALATVFVGSASAATSDRDVPQVSNPALQAQLERDAADRPLRQSAIGAAVAPRSQTAATPSQGQPGYTQERAQASGRGE